MNHNATDAKRLMHAWMVWSRLAFDEKKRIAERKSKMKR